MNIKQPAHQFLIEEDGAATPFAIFLACIFIVIGGLAVDFNKAVSERTQMQLATDSAAHAALYSWEADEPHEATNAALQTVTGMLPDVAYRNALLAEDIEYGYWDPTTETFTADPTFVEDKNIELRSAVRATSQLEPGRLNESRNIFLAMIGWETFTIRTQTIYATYYPGCFTEGFVADDVVDMQSNSLYLDGFCMHSNKYVSLNQNNFFEKGTVVSMPDLNDLDIPSSGFESNEGLQAALREGAYRMRILAQMPDMYQALYDGKMYHRSMELTGMAGVTEERMPMYPIKMGGNGKNNGTTEEDVQSAITAYESGNEVQMNDLPRMSSGDTGKKTMQPMQFSPRNHVFTANCSGNGDITMTAGHYRDFVLITDCPINFANGVVLDGVLIATEADVNGSHLQIGMNDNCDIDGNAGIWTMGSFRVASGMEAYGAQILAWGDVEFTANADGLEGVSVISYGKIDGTSNGKMGYCDGDGVENFVAASYFRMVR